MTFIIIHMSLWGMIACFVELICGYMCVRMWFHQPVSCPALWIAGLIGALINILWNVYHWNPCIRYSLKRFERGWIKDRKNKKGFLYHDGPGCYVILIYRFPRILPFTFGYSNVYVGQSMEVYHRVHNHLNRKGNGDVYADVREGKSAEIEIYPCKPSKLNDLERTLIRRYHAEDYYNRTAGGGTKRGIFRK